MIKFRLAENLSLDYSDFIDEGLRVAIFARSGGGKSNPAALFAEQALEQGLQTQVIEPLREYNTLNEPYDVVWVAKGGDLPLVTTNPEPYVKLLERGANMVFTAKSGNLDERSSLYGCCGRFTSLSGCRKLRVKILRKTRLGKPLMLK
jgi:DNA helicase HerA-like ATPase